MNELMKLEGNGFKWTSKDIENWTGKRHDNILADIRNEVDKLIEGGMEIFGSLNFQVSSYQHDSNTKAYPMYKLTKLGIQQLCMRYDAVIRAKVNMKLEEISKPMCIEDMIIQSAQQLKEVRLKQLEYDRRLSIVEAKQINSPYEFFSVVGYCNLHGVKCELSQAIKWGREATMISKQLGVKMGTTPDPRFGQVNTYHSDILKNIIGGLASEYRKI